jgi:hypothetical protein
MGEQIKAVERLAPGGLEHQRGPPRSRTSSKSGLCRRAVELVLESIFVCETIEADRRRIIRGQTSDNPRREARPNRVPIAVGAVPLFAVEETFAVLRTRRKLPS